MKRAVFQIIAFNIIMFLILSFKQSIVSSSLSIASLTFLEEVVILAFGVIIVLRNKLKEQKNG